MTCGVAFSHLVTTLHVKSHLVDILRTYFIVFVEIPEALLVGHIYNIIHSMLYYWPLLVLSISVLQFRFIYP